MGCISNDHQTPKNYQNLSYDDVSNFKTNIDEDGMKKVFGYDWRDRLIWTREYLNSTYYYQTDQTYDKAGNLLTVRDAKNQQTTFIYDDLNRNIKTTFPDTKNQTASYDAIGNLISTTDPKSQTIQLSYDEQGRVKKITYPNSTSITYSFDKAGNRISMSDLASSTTYSYDARNRLLSEAKTIGGAQYTTSFNYDAESRLTRLTYPDGYQLNYQYDGLDRVSSLGSLGSFTYTKDDKVKTITYGNGIQTTYTYDSRSRATRILVKDGAVTKLDLNYAYTGNGDVQSIDDGIAPTDETYGYDGLDRLTSSSGPWGTITYTYDQVGNRLTKTEGSQTTYTYGSYNRLTQAGSTNYTYDNNGNTMTKNDGVDSWSYTYDYNNMMTRAVKNGSSQGQYFYDGDGKRVKVTEGNTKVYTFLGLNIMYEKDVTADVVSKFFYANGLLIVASSS